VQLRQENARFYHENLGGVEAWEMPPLVDGATYSHFVIRVQERLPWIDAMRKSGVQLGELIQYSIPEMNAYQEYADGQFPRSSAAAKTTLNLPVDACIGESSRERIARAMRGIAQTFRDSCKTAAGNSSL
jgi:dTDP-4-amino-4,6-dideoxygalactose transaminase